MQKTEDYLDRFPPACRESADRAYQDGFADGANNAEPSPEEWALSRDVIRAVNWARLEGLYSNSFAAIHARGVMGFALANYNGAPLMFRGRLNRDEEAMEPTPELVGPFPFVLDWTGAPDLD